jgi:hypothetical protein
VGFPRSKDDPCQRLVSESPLGWGDHAPANPDRLERYANHWRGLAVFWQGYVGASATALALGVLLAGAPGVLGGGVGLKRRGDDDANAA